MEDIPKESMSLLPVGEIAPDFELPTLIGGVKRKFRLSSQRGKKNVVLAFHPSNWSDVSRTQLPAYQAESEKLLARNAVAVSVSVDSVVNTTAWEREIGPLDFAMCSDFWPHGYVCGLFGVLRLIEPMRGASERAVYVLDRDGRIVSRVGCGLDDIPSMAATFDILSSLS